MKKLLLFLLAALFCGYTASAQEKLSKTERRKIERQKTIDEINGIVEKKQFLFEITQMLSGSAQNNNTGIDMRTTGLSGYFLEVNGGELSVYMPYVGTAHTATLSGGAIDFKTKSFSVISTAKKDPTEGWLIEVKASDNTTGYVFLLDILQNGDTMLLCEISSKDKIRYKGNLLPIK